MSTASELPSAKLASQKLANQPSRRQYRSKPPAICTSRTHLASSLQSQTLSKSSRQGAHSNHSIVSDLTDNVWIDEPSNLPESPDESMYAPIVLANAASFTGKSALLSTASTVSGSADVNGDQIVTVRRASVVTFAATISSRRSSIGSSYRPTRPLSPSLLSSASSSSYCLLGSNSPTSHQLHVLNIPAAADSVIIADLDSQFATLQSRPRVSPRSTSWQANSVEVGVDEADIWLNVMRTVLVAAPTFPLKKTDGVAHRRRSTLSTTALPSPCLSASYPTSPSKSPLYYRNVYKSSARRSTISLSPSVRSSRRSVHSLSSRHLSPVRRTFGPTQRSSRDSPLAFVSSPIKKRSAHRKRKTKRTRPASPIRLRTVEGYDIEELDAFFGVKRDAGKAIRNGYGATGIERESKKGWEGVEDFHPLLETESLESSDYPSIRRSQLDDPSESLAGDGAIPFQDETQSPEVSVYSSQATSSSEGPQKAYKVMHAPCATSLFEPILKEKVSVRRSFKTFWSNMLETGYLGGKDPLRSRFE